MLVFSRENNSKKLILEQCYQDELKPHHSDGTCTAVRGVVYSVLCVSRGPRGFGGHGDERCRFPCLSGHVHPDVLVDVFLYSTNVLMISARVATPVA
jgi:hypothetical protein